MTCEECLHADRCEIRERLIEIESEFGIKHEVTYCPEYEPYGLDREEGEV